MTATDRGAATSPVAHEPSRHRPDRSEPERRRRVRSTGDVLHLVVGVVLVVVGLAVAKLFDGALLGLADDASGLVDGLPAWAHDLPGSVLAVLIVAAMAAALVAALVTRRYRRVLTLAGALVGSAAGSLLVARALEALVGPDAAAAIDAADPSIVLRGASTWSAASDPLLAAAVGVLTVGGSLVSPATARRLAWWIAAYVLVSVVTSDAPAVGVLADIGVGLLVGSGVLLIAGRHDPSPTRGEIADALAGIGLDPVELVPPTGDDQRWRATTSERAHLVVDAVGRDERSADLLVRAGRWLRLRDPGERRPFASLRRAVEHEALVSLHASTVGVPTPRLRGVAVAGRDGMVLAFDDPNGPTLAAAAAADPSPGDASALLDAAWRTAACLRRHRIAHRRLRADQLVISADGSAMVTGLDRGELAAADELLDADAAELLASTAATFGAAPAVDAALAALGPDELAGAAGWLQPVALTPPTREAIGSDELGALRSLVAERCDTSGEELVQIERVSTTTVLLIVTLALSAWFLLPQLADIDDVWQRVREASIGWAIVAVACSVLTYLAATAALLGAIPARLHFWPAFAAQIASSFANRITPAKVGGLATNIRYFQHQGVSTERAVAAVGLNAVTGVVVHVLLTLLFLLLASGDSASTGWSLPSRRVVVVTLTVLALVASVSAALRVVRRTVVVHVLPRLRSGWASIATVGRSPVRLALLVGGAAAITLSYLGAMVASLAAFGSSASFPIVALLFLTGTAVSNAAPTPGGLGAAEAALVAALSTVEAVEIVIPAVFLYRFVTFWLPILPGWVALTLLRRADQL